MNFRNIQTSKKFFCNCKGTSNNNNSNNNNNLNTKGFFACFKMDIFSKDVLTQMTTVIDLSCLQHLKQNVTNSLPESQPSILIQHTEITPPNSKVCLYWIK